MKAIFASVGLLLLAVLAFAVSAVVWMIPVYMVGSYYELPVQVMVGIAIGFTLLSNSFKHSAS